MPGGVQERYGTGEERDGADRPEGPLEPLRGPNDLAACGIDESQVERVEQPRTGEQGGQQTGEEENRERHQADHELTKVGVPWRNRISEITRTSIAKGPMDIRRVSRSRIGSEPGRRT